MSFDPFKQSKINQSYAKIKESEPNYADTTVYDISDLKRLAGIGTGIYPKDNTKPDEGANMSITGMKNVDIMKKHNIQPGTKEWFQLWFSLPYLTGEKPYGPGHNEINR